MVGHEIGGAIALGAHLLHDSGFSGILLLDAVVTAPWITATTRHQQKWLEAYRTMPVHIYERVAAAHLATAFHKAPPDEVFATYFAPWCGPDGQAAWYRKVDFDESYSDLIVPPLKDARVPVRVVWGEHDRWLTQDVAESVRAPSPRDTELRIVPDAGHFSPEDNPAAVADEIARFVS